MATTYSIVTGNGFTGNAQRCENTDNSQGIVQAAAASGITNANQMEWTITFKHRSNRGVNVNTGYGFGGTLDTVSANTGNAILHTVTLPIWHEDWYYDGEQWLIGISFEIVYNASGGWIEIDEVEMYPNSFGYPNIVSDGLILYLDAGNTNSYDFVNNLGVGTVFNDLSGNGNHAYGDPGAGGAGSDSGNFPVWGNGFLNSGCFYFDGNKGFTILTDLGAHSEVTGEVWVWRNADVFARYLFDARNDAGTYWLTNYVSYNINISNTFRANSPATYQYNSDWWDQWSHIVISSDASGGELWVNGVQQTLFDSSSFTENLGQYFRIGCRYDSTGKWYGYMSTIRFYNRKLTGGEIISNYNQEKTRYGY